MTYMPKKILYGTTSERPSPGIPGRIYISTDEEIIYFDNGLEWVPLGAVFK